MQGDPLTPAIQLIRFLTADNSIIKSRIEVSLHRFETSQRNGLDNIRTYSAQTDTYQEFLVRDGINVMRINVLVQNQLSSGVTKSGGVV